MPDLNKNQINCLAKVFHAAYEFDQKDEGTLEATDRENLKDAFAELIDSLDLIKGYQCVIDKFNAAVDDRKTKSDISCEARSKLAQAIVKTTPVQYVLQETIKEAAKHMTENPRQQLMEWVKDTMASMDRSEALKHGTKI